MANDLDRFVETPCLNCGEMLVGNYCAHCGQPVTDVDQSVGNMLGDFVRHGFSLDARVWRTFRLLLLKPGFLTLEYAVGHRARYFSPARLYLILSVVFFTALSLSGNAIRFNNENSDNSDRSGIVIFDDGSPADSLQVEEESEESEAGDDGSPPDSLHADAGDSTAGFWQSLLPSDDELERLADNPDAFKSGFASKVPKAMFPLLPAFALLLHVSYWRRHLPFLLHLVFALHLHAFYYFVQTCCVGLGATDVGALEIGVLLLNLVIPVYFFVALRRVYGGRVITTLLRLMFISVIYWALVGVVIAVVLFLQLKGF